MPTTDPARRDPAPAAYRLLVCVVRAVLPLLITRRYEGLHHVPLTGGVLVVSNHTSNFDTLTLGDALVRAGRWGRFLGKADLWKIPVLRWFAKQCRQIPVERHTERAKDSLVHAAAALDEGDCVVIFPEGTITRDPAGWPMAARHGAARLGLRTGVPVVPVAQFGPEQVLGGSNLELRKLFALRRRPIKLVVGPPIPFDDLRIEGEESSEAQVRAATARMTEALTELYAEVRGKPMPEQIWDPWQNTYVNRVG